MTSGLDIRPGELWWARLGASEGPEQGGCRPIVIINGFRYASLIDTLAMAIPVTTTDRGWPNHIPIIGPTPLAGFAMTEQPRTVSRSRLKMPAGSVEAPTLAEIRRGVHEFLEV